MCNIEEVIHFVEAKTGCDNIVATTDIFADLGCCGDDFHELMDEFGKTFNLDMTTYLWYFHTDEEGSWNSIGGLFVKAPHERVDRIPVTPSLLFEAVPKGKWSLQYPIHSLPKKRYDLIINQVVVIAFAVYLIYSCSK